MYDWLDGSATPVQTVSTVPADSGDGSQLTAISLVQSSTKDPDLVVLPALLDRFYRSPR